MNYDPRCFFVQGNLFAGFVVANFEKKKLEDGNTAVCLEAIHYCLPSP